MVLSLLAIEFYIYPISSWISYCVVDNVSSRMFYILIVDFLIFLNYFTFVLFPGEFYIV